uniref:Uncharacterized protein n=1 Tax=Knipowitschia caucasica TaxID=637954 RepID=A0AAV2J9U0_KNICA
MGPQPYVPCMLWTPSKKSCLAEVKQLEEFLNFHALSLHDTVKSRTAMVYRYGSDVRLDHMSVVDAKNSTEESAFDTSVRASSYNAGKATIEKYFLEGSL